MAGIPSTFLHDALRVPRLAAGGASARPLLTTGAAQGLEPKARFGANQPRRKQPPATLRRPQKNIFCASIAWSLNGLRDLAHFTNAPLLPNSRVSCKQRFLDECGVPGAGIGSTVKATE